MLDARSSKHNAVGSAGLNDLPKTSPDSASEPARHVVTPPVDVVVRAYVAGFGVPRLWWDRASEEDPSGKDADGQSGKQRLFFKLPHRIIHRINGHASRTPFGGNS
jgi:hypothetical protein